MAMLQSTIDVAKIHEIMARFRSITFMPAPAAPASATSPCLPPSPPSAHAPPSFPPLLLSTTTAQLGLARGLLLLPPLSIPKSHPSKPFSDLLTLSLLPPNPSPNIDRDLVPVASLRGIPMERDLLQKLRQPKVIVPQPFRPIGSSITIESIILDISSAPPVLAKKPKEVEEEMELRNRCC